MPLLELEKGLLFRMNPNPMWIYTYPGLKIVDVNDAAIQEYGYSRDEFLSMLTKDIRPESEFLKLLDVIKNGNLGCDNVGIWKHRRKDGTYFKAEMFLYTFEEQEGLYKIVQINKISDELDSTLIKNLSQKDLKYHLKNTPLLHLEWDSHLRIKSFSKDFITKYHFSYNDLYNQSYEALIQMTVGDTDVKAANKLMNEILNEGKTKTQADIRFYDKKGKVIYSRWYSSILRNDNGDVVSIMTLIEDNTKQKLAEKNLKHQNALINAIINSLPGIFYMIDENMRYIRWNKNFERLLGVTGQEMAYRFIGEHYSHEEMSLIKQKLEESSAKGSATAKIHIRDANGLNPLYQVTGIKINLNGHHYHLGMGVDISEIEKAQQLMSESLREKEVLLAEIHHRVKNNLAMISGLMELATYNVQNPVAIQTLKNSLLRIQSMALIHEKLYQFRELSKISMKNFVSELVQNIITTLSSTSEIELKTDIDKGFMNINQAIPTALIINEAVSNSVEHAFIGRGKGLINIELKLIDNRYYLKIADNGIGISKEIKMQTNNSLGLKLIETLSRQLHADLTIHNTHGTIISLQFKVENKKGIASYMVN